MEHAVILVVYNRFLGDCEAGKTLPSALPPDSTVLVFDNSGQDYQNAAFCSANGWIYFWERRNLGLAVAYQRCIDHLRNRGFYGLISVFDDDTCISPDYFPALKRAAEERAEVALFFPMLYAGGKLVSPQIIRPNQRAVYFTSEEACLSCEDSDLFAFNSGMAVRSEVYERVGYNTALFLDGIDYAFVQDCYRAGFHAAPFPVHMQHGFSGTQRVAYDTALKRFENYARDHAVVLKDNPAGYRYLIGKRALHLMLIYKKCSFISVYWRFKPRGTQLEHT